MIPYVLTFAEGILTFISPCILTMLPVYFMYLAGTSDLTGKSDESPTAGIANTSDPTSVSDESISSGTPNSTNSSRLLINSLGFVTGFTIVFIIFGATAATLGSFLDSNRGLLQKISGAIMVLFGLNFSGILRIGLLNGEKRFNARVDNLRFIGSIIFGIVFGFGWSPCLGTFLGSALMLAGNSETVTQGMLLLMVYSLGLAIPFVVSAAIFENVKGLFGWLKKNSRIINIISGILLIAAGILVFTDNLKYLL